MYTEREEGKRQEWKSVLIRAYEKNCTLSIVLRNSQIVIRLPTIMRCYLFTACMTNSINPLIYWTDTIECSCYTNKYRGFRPLSIRTLLWVCSQNSINSHLFLKRLTAEFSRLVPSLTTQYALSSWRIYLQGRAFRSRGATSDPRACLVKTFAKKNFPPTPPPPKKKAQKIQ
jgi:hypothetical protein